MQEWKFLPVVKKYFFGKAFNNCKISIFILCIFFVMLSNILSDDFRVLKLISSLYCTVSRVCLLLLICFM